MYIYKGHLDEIVINLFRLDIKGLEFEFNHKNVTLLNIFMKNFITNCDLFVSSDYYLQLYVEDI